MQHVLIIFFIMYSILDMPTLYIYSLDGVKYRNIIEVVMNLNLSMYFKAIVIS